jgi:hypothetical protein
MATIRDLCDKKVALFRDLDSLGPEQVAQEVVELSSLWASIQKELIAREMVYNVLMRDLIIEHKTAAKANVFGKASIAYKEFLTATAYSKSIQELIRTGKKFVSLNESVMRESKY